jgi:transposase-like protein
MIVELSVVEQGHQVVLKVLNDGATVTDVARRYTVPGDGARFELRIQLTAGALSATS